MGVVDVAPLVIGAESEGAKGLLLPAVKLKPAVGGWGLKALFWLLVPNAGNEEFTKELLGADDCAGGKLFVAPDPKAVLLLKLNRPPLLLLLLPGAGADAPKLKLGSGALKLALCDETCLPVLASRCC